MIIGEVAIIVTLVGWVVTPNITDLIKKARCWASSNYKWYTGLPEKLEKLAEDLEVIRDTVDATRIGIINDQTRNGRRLWQLMDAIHDAEEIMDEFELEILEANLKSRHQLRKAVDSSVDFAKQALGTKKSLNRLKKLVKRLDKLRQSSEDLRQVSQHGVRPAMLKENYSEREWKENLKGDHHDVVFAHLSSYQDLYSPQLQRCFAFCSIFPNKWRFEREKLIKMWIAHGFIEGTSDGGKSMEDVATGYFDDLLSRSLFEEVTDGVRDKETKYYVIREHIHSMIRQVSANYCFVSRSTLNIPATVRHLSVSSGCLDQLKAYSGRLGKVRTLLVFKDDPSSTSSPLSAIDSDIIKEFKGVRVLDLTDTGITELPESIGKLKHLRYLGLPNTIRKLRAQVTRLLLLQTFIVGKNCQLDDEFLDDMSSLINLRHHDFDIKYIAEIGGIGRLDKLQGSVEFHAHKRKEGHNMSELADMNSLRRTLSIKGLEKVATKEEAQDARLTSKQSLKVLKLEWGHPDPRLGATAGSSDAVLEGLQPDSSLQELRITRYPGTASPTWLADAGVLENLRSLYLRNCRKLQALPPVGRLPCLRLLIVKELCSVERIGSTFCGDPGTAFQALEKIVLEDMPKLVAWDAEDQSTGDGDDQPAALFPKLREVRISDCPLISSLSGLGGWRRSLRSLCVERCPGITEKSLPANFSSSGFPSLAGGLRIVECNLQLESRTTHVPHVLDPTDEASKELERAAYKGKAPVNEIGGRSSALRRRPGAVRIKEPVS